MEARKPSFLSKDDLSKKINEMRSSNFSEETIASKLGLDYSSLSDNKPKFTKILNKVDSLISSNSKEAKDIDDNLNAKQSKGYSKEELPELASSLKEAVNNLSESLDYKQKYSKSFYSESAKVWEKEGKQRVYIPRNAFEQAGYLTLDANDAKGRLASRVEGTPFYQVATRGGNMGSLDDAGKLIWSEFKLRYKKEKLYNSLLSKKTKK